MSSKAILAADLSPQLRPAFITLDVSPSPSPAPDSDDDSDTEVALNPEQQEKVIECFRDEKACETHLATCNANYAQEPKSIMDRVMIFVGGILVGMVIHNQIH
jgi:hypothetical protein